LQSSSDEDGDLKVLATLALPDVTNRGASIDSAGLPPKRRKFLNVSFSTGDHHGGHESTQEEEFH
jgi:hypothetical protein